jgi:small subunit ribosomal protein S21
MKVKSNTGPEPVDFSRFTPIQVVVEGNSREDFDYAVRKFKSVFQRERIAGQLKEREHFEKPGEKRRRKQREATERRLMTEYRERLVQTGEWERRQQKKVRENLQKKEIRAREKLNAI